MGAFLIMRTVRGHHRHARESLSASTMMQLIISIVGVLVFAGLTAYDTQRIKEMYFAADDEVVAGAKRCGRSRSTSTSSTCS